MCTHIAPYRLANISATLSTFCILPNIADGAIGYYSILTNTHMARKFVKDSCIEFYKDISDNGIVLKVYQLGCDVYYFFSTVDMQCKCS